MKIHIIDQSSQEVIASIKMRATTTLEEAHIFAQNYIQKHAEYMYVLERSSNVLHVQDFIENYVIQSHEQPVSH